MRILYIVHDGNIYGSQKSLLLLLKALLEKNEDYTLFVSLARDGALESELATLGITTFRHKRLQWFKHDKRTALQRIFDALGVMMNAPARVFKIYSYIKKHRIDLVHTNSVVSLEGSLAAKLAGIPHVWHIRELFMEDSPKLIPIFGKRFSRTLIESCSNFRICISKAVQSQFLSPIEQNPLIYNVLSPEQILLPGESEKNAFNPQRPLRIGYAGRLSEGKGFHDILDSLLIFRERYPNQPQPVVSVVGNFVDTAYQQRIESFVKSNGLACQVSFLGYQDEMRPWYREIDVLVVPSKNEPFGRVIIETMAMGIPCIGADSGGIPEIITHDETGWLYPTGSPAALADTLQLIYQSPGLLEKISQKAGRMVMERFTIEQQRREIESLYQRL